MRPASTDFYQGFRYHVVVDVADSTNILNVERGQGLNPNAGFQSVTLPDMTLEAVEYREGNTKYTFKQVGIPTFSDCTMMRGVTTNDTTFWRWGKMALEGQNYRADCAIYHYSRDEMEDGLAVSVPAPPSKRHIVCRECIPIRVKIAGDFDATASDVSLAEVDFALEYFDVYVNGTIVEL